MSTVGTLYDETVKFGYGKLLQVSTASGASSIDFVAPLALDYDTYWFDLDALKASISSILLIYTSTNSGGSWDTAAGSYYSTFLHQPTEAGAASYSSVAIGETPFMRVGPAPIVPAGAYPIDGRVYFNPGLRAGSGHRQFDWVIIGVAPSGYLVAYTGGGAFTGFCPNGVRFFFGGGSTISGIIRCYGMKKGQGA